MWRLNSKISVTGTSCWSCQQLRLIFSSRTQMISIRLHMQDHNIPLSLSIISVYILTVLVLWNMFSKGHITVTSCLFLQYDPSLEIFNMVFNTLWNIWHGFQHSFQHGSYHRWIFMFEMCWKHLEKAFWKFQNVLKSVIHVEN